MYLYFFFSKTEIKTKLAYLRRYRKKEQKLWSKVNIIEEGVVSYYLRQMTISFTLKQHVLALIKVIWNR